MIDMDIHLDRRHSGAVCREIGERLSMALGPPSRELPPHLLALLEQLAMAEPPNPRP
jgi:nitrate reductase assembly molybdenum cofactor insertion protein NarJ